MSMRNFDLRGLDQWIKNLREAGVSMEDELDNWLDAMGMGFLSEIQEQIIRMHVVDTRRLLNSFTRSGSSDHIWRRQMGRLLLEAGTNVEYAQAVNDGHWTKAKKRWINGRPYFDVAFAVFQNLFNAELEAKLRDITERLGPS